MPGECEQQGQEEGEEDWPDLLPGLDDNDDDEEKEAAARSSPAGDAAKAAAQVLHDSASEPYAEGPLAGVTRVEVEVCVKVLQAIRGDVKGFAVQGSQKGDSGTAAQSAARKAPWADDCRALRKELMPLVERLSAKLYAGRNPDQYKGDRWQRKQERGKDAQARAMDARRINGTRLRNARLVALQKLQEQPGDVPLIPDGAVAEDAEVGGTLADGAAGAVHGGWAAYYAGVSTKTGGQSVVEDVGCAADPTGSARTPHLKPEPEPEPQPRTEADVDAEKLAFDRSCYTCKARYRLLHHFYDQLCPDCAELNWRKRTQSARLEGSVALVTGGRVKIGFQVVLKLLRAGARVIVTSRFPVL
jgi:hypothetical protein